MAEDLMYAVCRWHSKHHLTEECAQTVCLQHTNPQEWQKNLYRGLDLSLYRSLQVQEMAF
jgi:hypothetical protein